MNRAMRNSGLAATPTLRQRLVTRLAEHLGSTWQPQFEMALLVALAGLAGFVASSVLLRMMAYHMGFRYAVAALVAYTFFIALLRLWVALHRQRIDVTGDLAEALLRGLEAPRLGAPPFQGGGGEFGGGGAQSSFADADTARIVVHTVRSQPRAFAEGTAKGGAGGDFALDDLLAVATLGALVAAGLVAAGYLVSAAPETLAELLLDGGLSAGLYRKLRTAAARNFLDTAVNRTAVPFLVVFFFFVVGGTLLQGLYPSCHTLGAVLRAVFGGKP